MKDDIFESNTYFTPEFVEPVEPATYRNAEPPSFGGLYAQDEVNAPIAQSFKPSFWNYINTPRTPGADSTKPLVTGLRGFGNLFALGREIDAANRPLYDADEARAIQRQQLQRQAKLDDQQGLIRGLDLVNKGGNLQGATRKAYFEQLRKNFSKLTGSEDTTLLDTFEKAKDDEAKVLMDGLKAYAQQLGLGISDIPNLTQDPELFLKLSELGLKAQKQKQEAERLKFLQDAVRGADSEGPPAGELTPPLQPQPQQTQRPPAGVPRAYFDPSQQAIQQKIIAAANRHGLGDQGAQALLGIAAVETGFRNIDNNRKDPRDGIGIFQFTPGTGAQYGMKPKPRLADGSPDPTDPRLNIDANIEAGAKLLKDNLARYGSLDKAIAAHNGDQTGKYLEMVKDKMSKFGGRTSTQAVADQANPEEQAAIQQNKIAIQKANEAIKRLKPLAGDPTADRYINFFQEERKFAQSEISRIESLYDKNKASQAEQIAARRLGYQQPWAQLNKEQKQNATDLAPLIEAKDSALKAKEELEATAPIKRQLAEAGNPSQPIKNINEYRFADGTAIPAGWTMADIKEANDKAKAAGLPEAIYQVTKMPEKAENDGESHYNGLKAIRRVLELTKDTQVEKLVGNVFSNPEGSITKILHDVFGANIPPKYTEVAAEVAGLTSEILHAKLGANQTVKEFARIKPLIAQLSDPTVTDVNIKMRVLHDVMAEEFNTRLKGYRKRKYDYNPEWEEQPILRDQKSAEAPQAPSAPAPAPTPKATRSKKVDQLLKNLEN